MKVRVKFSKTGLMKYIGHLDIMRFFQKAVRRAGIDIRYSEGFSPHQVMSFALPLGVGVTSEGEYFDMELKSPASTRLLQKQLNAQMPEDMAVLSCRMLPDDAKRAMAVIAAADYRVSFREGVLPPAGWDSHLTAFLAQEEILLERQGKKTLQTVNIRPAIYGMQAQEDNTIWMRLGAASSDYLKPQAVWEAFCSFAGIPFDSGALRVHRLELYCRDAQDGFLSLEDAGKEFETP